MGMILVTCLHSIVIQFDDLELLNFSSTAEKGLKSIALDGIFGQCIRCVEFGCVTVSETRNIL